jgi:hypothetical protein
MLGLIFLVPVQQESVVRMKTAISKLRQQHSRTEEWSIQELKSEDNQKKGKSLIDPPAIGGGLVYPLNYETV